MNWTPQSDSVFVAGHHDLALFRFGRDFEALRDGARSMTSE
jgi:hypothetical protein